MKVLGSNLSYKLISRSQLERSTFTTYQSLKIVKETLLLKSISIIRKT